MSGSGRCPDCPFPTTSRPLVAVDVVPTLDPQAPMVVGEHGHYGAFSVAIQDAIARSESFTGGFADDLAYDVLCGLIDAGFLAWPIERQRPVLAAATGGAS